jgi:hypothetical protein
MFSREFCSDHGLASFSDEEGFAFGGGLDEAREVGFGGATGAGGHADFFWI